MATILLAMFIVLSTLGKDQTGASLQKGLESWRETHQNFGLPGIFNTSDRPGGLGSTGPHYNVEGDAGDGVGYGDRPGQSVDQENEKFQHFLGEMERQFKVDKLPHTIGQATVDLYDPFNKVPPYWTAKQQQLLSQVVPMLRRGDYGVVLIVWAPMAKESAMLRTAEKAKEVAEELAITAQLDTNARKRLIAVAKTWAYVDYQRPVASVVITRTAKTTTKR
jgi:hypothetical protein